MANENVPAPAPTRSNDQILPFAAWVPIRKSNFILDLQKKQKSPIFQISVDILQNTNFFRAFTTSASVPAIYIQQFYNTLTHKAKTGAYSFLLDENRFILDANLLRKALEITLIDQAHQFVSPPSGDGIMDFVNELGYIGELHFVSRMAVNNLYQPWRAIFTNVDYAELMWKEFLQAIQIFLTDKANLSIAPPKGKKTKPYVIPYCRFTKLIICHLGRTHNIHQRFASPFHLAEEDHRLGNLKFIPKGEEDGVFRMQIPKELITNIIRNTPYYNAYLEMVAKHDRKIVTAEGGNKKSTSKANQSKKPTTAKKSNPVSTKQPRPAPSKKPNAAQEKPSEPSPAKQSKRGKVLKVRKGKSPLKLIDKEVHHEPEPQGEGEEYDVERAIQMSLETFQAHGQAPIGGVAFHEPTASDPGKIPESRPPPEHVLMEEDQAGPDLGQSHVALVGPNMHDDFIATMYPRVHESLKHPDEEYAQVENPLSSTGTLSSIKNLDAYTFGDQFFNDKPTEEELDKENMETKVESMVTVLIHQTSFSAHPLSTLVIDLTSPKPVSSTIEEQDQKTQALSSRIFTLELRDLPHKINQTVNEVVKEVVHVALQAPLRDRFRELPEADIKEILHQWMFENVSYKSLSEHVALYEALEASMERAQRDEFLVEKDKSRKRQRDDQDPPPHPPDSDLNKKKSHNSDTSGSSQPPAPQSLAWKKSNTREAHSSSSKQKSEEDRPATPEPDWSIPTNDLPEPEKNWANAFTKSYKDPKENKLLRNTGDMGSFITWFCKRIGKKKLNKSDLEGPSFKIDSEREYDISAAYGISHWWFKRKEFYITRHNTLSDRSKVRSYMRILSVVSLKTLERYGYTYLKEIVLRRADYKEYKTSEADFKNLHPNDFKDLYLLHLQGQLNHLSGEDKVHLFNSVNLWIRNIVIRKRVEDLQLGIEIYQTKLNLTQLD
ncbi:hypothetical protein Tco_0560865 [Tanacetum coccineum]